METTLLLLGIACIIAAIVGGGLRAAGFEFPALNSYLACSINWFILIFMMMIFFSDHPTLV